MADFCKQCSEELFGEDFADFAGTCDRGAHTTVLCEGCGVSVVDYTGTCTSTNCLKEHGIPKIGDACCAAVYADGEYWFGTITQVEDDLAWSNLGSKFLPEEFCGDLPTRKLDGVWLFESF